MVFRVCDAIAPGPVAGVQPADRVGNGQISGNGKGKESGRQHSSKRTLRYQRSSTDGETGARASERGAGTGAGGTKTALDRLVANITIVYTREERDESYKSKRAREATEFRKDRTACPSRR